LHGLKARPIKKKINAEWCGKQHLFEGNFFFHICKIGLISTLVAEQKEKKVPNLSHTVK
jgi:hypothetical protein